MGVLVSLVRDARNRPYCVAAIWFLIAMVASSVFAQDHSRHIRDIAGPISGLVNTVFLTSGYLLLLLPSLWRRDWREFILVAGIGIAMTILAQGLKFTVGHWLPRPSGSPGGFPSGHAMAAFTLAFLIHRRLPRVGWLAYAVAALITWARVANHDHWFYQVAAGAILGLVVTALIDRRFYRKELEPTPGHQGIPVL